ncbi:MAG: pentapeptide repeat-containing protein [Gemmatimonadota bacterium]|nr:pentapeptide repeat-containing protein [Gemmatimonadota bacterium]
MNFFFKTKENRFFIFLGDCFCRLLSPWTPLTVLLIIAVYVMFGEGKYISELLGVSSKEAPKNEVLKIIGILMGGILVAWQAWASHRRAKTMEETAKSQVRATEEQARANENTEQGLRQERLKNAIEHLGHEKDSVRLGGAYELFHLAEDSKDLRKTALDMLCLHIRQTTSEGEYRKKHKSKPSEEVQSLLTLLFVQDHEIFKGLQINLQGSWLNGADLWGARLEKAFLTRVNLQGATLTEAHLQGAVLTGAYLQKADLREARLQGVHLDKAYLQEANLSKACLQGATLIEARLQGVILKWAYSQGAILYRAYLQKADLSGARLQGAILYFANLQCANMKDIGLQGAILCGSHLQGAILWMAHLQGVVGVKHLPMDFQGELHMWGAEAWRNFRKPSRFAKRIRESIDREDDISGMVFAGGLTKEDVDAFVEGLSNRKAKELREKLEPHVDRDPSLELPTDSEAITGAYTEEEAEQWIAEYEKAMSEVPEDDS